MGDNVAQLVCLARRCQRRRAAGHVAVSMNVRGAAHLWPSLVPTNGSSAINVPKMRTVPAHTMVLPSLRMNVLKVPAPLRSIAGELWLM